MKFSVPLIGILTFSICLCLHILIWRWWCPRRRVVVLLSLFIILPLLFIIGYIVLECLECLPSIMPFTLAEWSMIYLLHFALSFAYILSYPAIEAVSPSLAISLMVGDSNPQGMLHEDLLHVFGDEIVLEPRIQDLIEAGLIIETNGYFTVTSRGITFVKCFILLRRLLGLPIGKG